MKVNDISYFRAWPNGREVLVLMEDGTGRELVKIQAGQKPSIAPDLEASDLPAVAEALAYAARNYLDLIEREYPDIPKEQFDA